MGRKGIEINPKTAERIKIFCKEQGITQKTLALAIDYTPEYINGIANGKKGLSFEAAQRVCNAFPATEYRPEWLLGQDDVKTREEWRDIIKKGREKDKEIRDEWLLAVISMARHWPDSMNLIQTDDGGLLIKHAVDSSNGLHIVTELSSEQTKHFVDEIRDFIEMRVRWLTHSYPGYRLIKESELPNGSGNHVSQEQ